MRPFCLLTLVQLMTVAALAQHPAAFPPAIEDNSFFIEEAYNQEPRVVQHITNAAWFFTPADFSFSFTQEWPVGSQDHQLSYTLPYASPAGMSVSGIGDVLLNYRYQAYDEGEDGFAFAPRLSVILPTGKKENGLGSGVVGVQINLPYSRRLSRDWVIHLNAGGTILPNVKGEAGGTERTLSDMVGGTSIIWLASENLNLMLEALVTNAGEIAATGEVVRSTGAIVNPGLRYAIDVGSLQIVPGISVPVSITEGATQAGMLLYLSFEHPF